MKERPILFSAPMVRALLDGSKTQTRRIAKEFAGRHELDAILKRFPDQNGCPYGQPGDRLWVRETWRTTGDGGRADYLAPRDIQPHPVWYDADGAAPSDQCAGKTRVSIHMPRWASRILLEIVSVRVERLNDISDADARAEGATGGHGVVPIYHYNATPSEHFSHIWESINGAGSWAANPWVWVIEFKRIAP